MLFRIMCGICLDGIDIGEENNNLQVFFGDKIEIKADAYRHIKIKCRGCGNQIIFRSPKD